MSAAVALMLEGMPSPWDLHLHRAAGRVVVLAGSTVVAEYGETDLAMRNMVIGRAAGGVSRRRVAEVFGLTPTYVARLSPPRRGMARRRWPGRAARAARGRWGEDKQDLARQWRAQGESDLEIGLRLGVAGTTVARRLAGQPAETGAGLRQEELELRRRDRRWLQDGSRSQGRGTIQGGSSRSLRAGPGGGEPAGAAPGGAGDGPPSLPPGPGGPRITGGAFWSVRGGDAAARVHGPCRGGAGAGVRRRGRARRGRVPVRRCGVAVGDQHVLRAGGADDPAGQAPDGRARGAAGRAGGRCRTCGPCVPGWPRSRMRPIRWRCRRWPPARCWPPTRSPPGSITSMTISSPTRRAAAGREGLEQQARQGGEGPRGHPRHRA